MNRRQMIAALAGTTALRGPANITELDRHLLSFGRPTLERDDFSSNHHPALALCLSMIFFRKPVPTFRDHALGGEQQNHAADAYGHGGYEPRMDALAFQESKA